jgi:hypothetical protein
MSAKTQVMYLWYHTRPVVLCTSQQYKLGTVLSGVMKYGDADWPAKRDKPELTTLAKIDIEVLA